MTYYVLCSQVWNYNIMLDTFMGQMTVPVPSDGDSPRVTERYTIIIIIIILKSVHVNFDPGCCKAYNDYSHSDLY